MQSITEPVRVQLQAFMGYGEILGTDDIGNHSNIAEQRKKKREIEGRAVLPQVLSRTVILIDSCEENIQA